MREELDGQGGEGNAKGDTIPPPLRLRSLRPVGYKGASYERKGGSV